MKITLLFLLLTSFAFGQYGLVPWTYRTDTSTNAGSISATNPANPQLFGPTQNIYVIQIDNGTTGEVEVNCSGQNLAGTATVALGSWFVGPTTTWQTPYPNQDGAKPMATTCWFRSVSGYITSGIFRATAWGY